MGAERKHVLSAAKELILHTDGAARGNPGPAGIGIVISNSQGTILKKMEKYIGKRTNNEAEYRALINALKLALEYESKDIKVFSDSSLLVNQIRGEFKVKKPHLKILYQQATDLIKVFSSFEIVHVTREKNRIADRLANQAIEKYFKGTKGN